MGNVGMTQVLRTGRTRARGVTAIELIIVISLMVMLAAIAIPTMGPAILSNRLRGAAWQLAGDLRLSRQKAVSYRIRYRLCMTSCTLSVGAGQYSLEREPATNVWVNDAGGVVTKLPTGVSLTTTASGGKVTFDKKGAASGATFTLTNLSGTYQVVVGSTGRVRVCSGNCT